MNINGYMRSKLALILSALIILLILPLQAFAEGEASLAPAEPGSAGLLALTFDDGPGPYTERLLNELKTRGVRVTFFMVGKNTAGIYKPLVGRMIREGHQAASHSYKHAWLTKYSLASLENDLQTTRDLLDEGAGGHYSYMLRPPYGGVNDRVKKNAGSPLILWSVDPYDWKYRDAQVVSEDVINTAKDGDIILLHDIHETSVEAALIIIDSLREKGFEFVTVTELARRKGAEPENGTTYRSFRGETVAERAEAPELTVSPCAGGFRVLVKRRCDAPVYFSSDLGEPSQSQPLDRAKLQVPADSVIRCFAAYDVNGDRSEEIMIDLHDEGWLR